MNTMVIHQRHSIRSRLRLSLTALAMAALLGCSPMQSSHGYIPDDELVAKLRPGVHDRDSVTSLFGSPTSVADFNGETWLYIKRDSEHIAFFDEELLAQAVLAVWPGPVLDLSGRANPRVSAAVMARARLFLGTDGGPMHLAASTGTRCLALFSGYNEPGRWYPMGPGHQILRENVMTEIEPSRVASAVRAML